MARRPEGSAFESRGKVFARVTVAPKTPRALLLPWCMSKADGRVRALAIQAVIDRLRESGFERGIETTLEAAAKLESSAEMMKLARFVERIVQGKEPAPWDHVTAIGAGETFEMFAMRWVKGELAAKWPDHVERKRTAASSPLTHRIANISNVSPAPMAVT